jgi:ribonuclease HI
MDNTTKIVQWNCRGLRANYTDLDILFQTYNPVAFCLQETLQSDTNLTKFRYYNPFYKNSFKSDGSPGGGVAILVKNNIPHSEITLTTALQATAVRTTLHRTFTLCSLYLPPSKSVTLTELTDLILELSPPILLMGDLNGHNPLWGGNCLDNKGKIIEDLIANNNLILLNTKDATYMHPATGTKTSIDITLSDPNLALDLEWAVHDDLCSSDHYPVIVTCNKPTPADAVARWKIKKGDWSSFQTLCLAHLCADAVATSDDPVSYFTAGLIKAAEVTVPKTKPSRSHIRKPWFDEDCLCAIRSRKQALRRFCNVPTTQNLDTFRIMRAKARRTIRAAKKSSWRDYVSELNTKTTSKKIWDMVRKISGRTARNPIKHLNSNGTLITDTTDIANTLAATFSYNSSVNHYTHKFKQYKLTQEINQPNFKSDNNEPYNCTFSLKELQNAIHASSDSAPGPDDIHYQFLKHLPQPTLNMLLDVFNKLWVSGTFPDNWGQAIVIAIPKADKDHTDPNNYRPIALTSCLCKTMERMVNNRLVYYLERNGFLAETQSGFRSQRSSVDQLVRLESWIREGLVSREHVVTVFFDLEKAYDTAWRHGILLDLFKVGLRGRLTTFVVNFLSNRTFKVKVGTTFSDPFNQEAGVPQGSILSVTLFNLRINSIVSCVPHGIDNSLYVDDFAACTRAKQMRTIERKLQLFLNTLQIWADTNGFKFSASKTVCVHFCNQRGLHPDPQLYLNGQPIPVVKETKFLGVIFDSKLSFIPHLKHLRSKCKNSLNLLNIVSHRDWGGDTEVLLRLYKHLVRAKLDYGSVVYGSARNSYLSMLDPIQNQSLRLCLGAFRTSPVESLQVEANEAPLSIRRNKLAVQYITRIKSNPNNPTYTCCFNLQNTNRFVNKPSFIQPFGMRMQTIIDDMNLNLKVVARFRFANLGPWMLRLPRVLLSLHTGAKAGTSPHIHKEQFNVFLSSALDSIHIYTDGSKDHTGTACAAVSNGRLLLCRLPDEASIFTAEARGIILALKIVETTQASKFIIFSDSLSCLQAIKHPCWKNPVILDIIEKTHILLVAGKEVKLCWLPSHVGIKGNEAADRAAKTALLLDIDQDIRLPYSDFKQIINKYFQHAWQEQWNSIVSNKLKTIKPILSDTMLKVIHRRDEVVLHRARIGHTYLTHAHLLRHENAPECGVCHCLQTVQHVLMECPNYIQYRVKYSFPNSLTDLFTKTPHSKIIGYLKDTKFYDLF